MEKKFPWATVLFLALAFSPTVLWADTLYLKSGGTISGKILFEDVRFVTIEEQLGDFGFSRMTYPKYKIASIKHGGKIINALGERKTHSPREEDGCAPTIITAPAPTVRYMILNTGELPAKEYEPAEKAKYVRVCNNGMSEGPFKIYYYENGQLQAQGVYMNSAILKNRASPGQSKQHSGSRPFMDEQITRGSEFEEAS